MKSAMNCESETNHLIQSKLRGTMKYDYVYPVDWELTEEKM